MRRPLSRNGEAVFVKDTSCAYVGPEKFGFFPMRAGFQPRLSEAQNTAVSSENTGRYEGTFSFFMATEISR